MWLASEDCSLLPGKPAYYLTIEYLIINVDSFNIPGSWFGKYKRCGDDLEGPREVTRGGGGEREPNQLLLQELDYVPISNPKPKPYKKVINTPTNSIKMVPLKLRTQQKRMGSIRHPVSKIWPKQSSNIAAENI
jgi:hypothetical protein